MKSLPALLLLGLLITAPVMAQFGRGYRIYQNDPPVREFTAAR